MVSSECSQHKLRCNVQSIEVVLESSKEVANSIEEVDLITMANLLGELSSAFDMFVGSQELIDLSTSNHLMFSFLNECEGSSATSQKISFIQSSFFNFAMILPFKDSEESRSEIRAVINDFLENLVGYIQRFISLKEDSLYVAKTCYSADSSMGAHADSLSVIDKNLTDKANKVMEHWLKMMSIKKT